MFLLNILNINLFFSLCDRNKSATSVPGNQNQILRLILFIFIIWLSKKKKIKMRKK